jgi:hypothetical protein
MGLRRQIAPKPCPGSVGPARYHWQINDEMPDHHDFVYLALTLGVSFAVSNTNESTSVGLRCNRSRVSTSGSGVGSTHHPEGATLMADELSQDIRTKLDALIEQARNDDALLSRFREDTTAVLIEAGIPDDTATLLAEHDLGFAEAGSDVAGYMRGGNNTIVAGGYCHFTCDEYSCQISICNMIPLTN